MPADLPASHEVEGLPEIKPEDYQYFASLLQDVDEDSMKPEELKERNILKMLLKIKNGTPPQRKQALRHLTDKARDLGAGPLFNQILPLLMSPTLEDQERHLLVKVIDRILFKLDDLVRPFVHKILVRSPLPCVLLRCMVSLCGHRCAVLSKVVHCCSSIS